MHEGFITFDDGKLYYRRNQSSKVAIVFLHGGPGLDHCYFLPHMQPITKQYPVVFYDQRGSGKSLDMDISVDKLTVSQFVQDLEQLRQGLGLTQMILAGHSWGGFLGAQYALRYPECMNSLLLLTPMPFTSEGQRCMSEEFAKRAREIYESISALFDETRLKSLEKEAIIKAWQRLFSVYMADPKHSDRLRMNGELASEIGGVRVRNGLTSTWVFQDDLNELPRLNSLDIPALVIHGERDIEPLQASQELAAALPNAELKIIEKCGHFPFIEQPECFFEHVLHFLNKTDAPRCALG